MRDYKGIGSYKASKRMHVGEVVANLLPAAMVVVMLALFVGVVGPVFVSFFEGLNKALSVLG